MAKLEFTYDGNEKRVLDVEVLLMSEAETCEKLTGWTEDEWRQAMVDNRVQALKFAWWLAGKRAGVEEQYSTVDLDLRKLNTDVALDAEEQAVLDEEADAALPTSSDEVEETVVG